MLTLTSPVEIWANRLPAGLKLAALALTTTGLFALASPQALALAAFAVAAFYGSGGWVFAKTGLRLLRPLWPFVLIVALWHLWTRDFSGGTVILLRMICAVSLANFVTLTTRLSDMIMVFQWVARPLQVFGLSSRRLALALALVVRFIPVMLDRLTQITQSWSARSPRRPGWQVLVPATIAALDDADRAAEALRARGGAD